MTSKFHILPLRFEQVESQAICRLWNASFEGQFRLTERLWLQNTSGNPAFEAANLLLAHSPEGEFAGMALAGQWPEPTLASHSGLDKYRHTGYLSVLAVHPAYRRQGLGRMLLEAAEDQLWQTGVGLIRLGTNFGHFFPGLPANLPGAQPLFSQAGYVFSNLEYDLDGDLEPELFEPFLQTGMVYRQARPDDLANLLAFLDRVFPGRWAYTVRWSLHEGMALENISLMLGETNQVQGFLMTFPFGSRPIGPSAYWLSEKPEWGGIGPLGIDPVLRGKGGGLGLVAAGMRHLYKKGARKARIDWTTLVDFYGKLGFKPEITYRPAHKFKPGSGPNIVEV